MEKEKEERDKKSIQRPMVPPLGTVGKKGSKFGHCIAWKGGAVGSGLAQIVWSTFLFRGEIVYFFLYRGVLQGYCM